MIGTVSSPKIRALHPFGLNQRGAIYRSWCKPPHCCPRCCPNPAGTGMCNLLPLLRSHNNILGSRSNYFSTFIDAESSCAQITRCTCRHTGMYLPSTKPCTRIILRISSLEIIFLFVDWKKEGARFSLVHERKPALSDVLTVMLFKECFKTA